MLYAKVDGRHKGSPVRHITHWGRDMAGNRTCRTTINWAEWPCTEVTGAYSLYEEDDIIPGEMKHDNDNDFDFPSSLKKVEKYSEPV